MLTFAAADRSAGARVSVVIGGSCLARISRHRERPAELQMCERADGIQADQTAMVEEPSETRPRLGVSLQRHQRSLDSPSPVVNRARPPALVSASHSPML